MYYLGISAFFHDSSAALLKDGEIIAAAQEERFTRIKHDASFPKNAIQYCLKEAGITASKLDHVAYFEKPLLKFDRLISSYLHDSPKGLNSFLKAVPQWLNKKFFIEIFSRPFVWYGSTKVAVGWEKSNTFAQNIREL